MEQFKTIESQFFQKLNRDLAAQLNKTRREVEKCKDIIKMCKQVLESPTSRAIENLIEEIEKVEGDTDDENRSEEDT
jgi:uncharacterized protein Yka (UPF0111/DUF47 family)